VTFFVHYFPFAARPQVLKVIIVKMRPCVSSRHLLMFAISIVDGLFFGPVLLPPPPLDGFAQW